MSKLTKIAAATVVAMGLGLGVAGQAQGSPIAYYSFDEISGTVAHDFIGSADGTLQGAAMFVPGAGINGSGAVSLNRVTSDLVDMGDSFGFANFSIQSWVKLNAGDTTISVPFGKHIAGAGIGYYLSISEGGPTGVARLYPGSYPFTDYTSTPVNDGLWHQLVGTYDNASHTASIYVDGLLEASVVGANTAFNNVSFLIGGTTHGPTYTGLIDEVRVYDNALSASEVQSLYLAVTAVPEPETYTLLGVGLLCFLAVRRQRGTVR